MQNLRFCVRALAARSVDVALTEPFAIAGGAQHSARNVLVSLELGSGVRGLGEAAPFPVVSGETQESSLAAIERVKSLLIGQDVRGYRLLSEKLDAALGEQRAALAGLEHAMFDALTRELGISLADFFGGARAGVSTDMTITASSVEHARNAAREAVAGGFGELKVKVGGQDPEFDLERLLAIAESSPRSLLLDANGGYSEEHAAFLLRELRKRELPVTLFEEPLARGNFDGLTRLAEFGVPLAADESARSVADVVELGRAKCVQYVNLKVQKTGVLGALAIAEVARGLGLGLMMGGMVESEIGMTFSAQLASGLGGVRFVDLDTPFWFRAPLTHEGYRTQGSRILIDYEKPGLGLTALTLHQPHLPQTEA